MSVLRPWQVRNVAAAREAPPVPGARVAYVAPTGVGKSRAIREVRNALRAAGRCALITTPSGEIVRGMLDQAGVFDRGAEVGEAALWRAAEAEGIYSPVRLRNRLLAGAVAAPDILLVDELHHTSAASEAVWARLVEALPGVPLLGWTATPYRGSHKETLALREWWGEPEVLVTIEDAARDGYLSIPRPEVWPLLDDSGAKVAAGGEFDAEDVARLTGEQRASERLIERIVASGWCRSPVFAAPAQWDRPTLIAVASVALAHEVAEKLSAAGLQAAAVSGDTPRAERDVLLARCRAGEVALVQVQVLAEGVDMPWLRRLLDLRPLRSPVAWMQLLGRITRPVTAGEAAPEYICGCRNAERHGYLMSGRWPARRLAAETQAAFGGERSGGGPLERGVAKDALNGRQIVRVPLLGGGAAEVVHLAAAVDWQTTREILAVGVPGEERPRCFARDITGGNGERSWGKWRASDLDPSGYQGWTRPAPAKALSEKMGAWWRRSAAGFGLDPAAKVTRREFAVLPALADSRTTLLQERAESGAKPTTDPSGGCPSAPSVPSSPSIPAAGAQGIAPAAESFNEDAAERAAIESVEAEEEGIPMPPPDGTPIPATWAKLRDGTWGARVEAMGVEPGMELRMRAKSGREEVRAVAEIVARGSGWTLARLSERSLAIVDLPEASYAVEDTAGVLRFFVVGSRGKCWEQAGPEFHPVFEPRGARLAALVRAAGLEECCARYGREIGRCGRCRLALTNAESRARGIGPECAKKGW